MTDTFGRRERDSPSEFQPQTLEVLGSDASGRPEAYTFVPRDADAAERQTTWLTADRASVVDLEAWQ
ncbi:hypothetical protein HWV23_10295 [Natronomonas halophila]|uniref:DUF7511 domain-containing protein n=1 Tax=Natronomonas halophila TaxID=2747817 RepID=UPI0015B424A2|nr:hypothetical protein [Natronomonas halophila]QLD86100.1 hypothetical protein HWV23_10295 [Natronomonas halophila]